MLNPKFSKFRSGFKANSFTKDNMQKIREVFSFIWKEFIYGGHLQCLGFVGIVYISSFLLNIQAKWEILLSAYLIFYPVYINDRLKDIKSDELTNPERTKHFKEYLSFMPKIILISILLLVMLLIYIGNFKFSIFALLLLFFGLFYPFFFKKFTKRIIAFKDFYVSAFFAAIAVAPIIYFPSSLSSTSIISLASLMFFIFLKSVLLQIFLDLKDVEKDQSLGLLTIPALRGREKTLFFLKISTLLVTSLILMITIFFLRVFPLQMLILLFIIPFNFYSYNLSQKQNYFGYILGSSEFLFWAILIFLTKVIPI